MLGIEARGFIFAPGAGLCTGRGLRPGAQAEETPAECVSVSYDLEYGTDTLEMHRDAVGSGQPRADRRRSAGHRRHGGRDRRHGARRRAARWSGMGFVVELTFLNGREKLDGYDVFSLLQYDK